MKPFRASLALPGLRIPVRVEAVPALKVTRLDLGYEITHTLTVEQRAGFAMQAAARA